MASLEGEKDLEPLEQPLTSGEKSLDDCKITVEGVPKCKCVLVTGLSTATTTDALQFYFENPRSGCGQEPSKIELHDGQAWVHFNSYPDLKELWKTDHTLDGAALKMEPLYDSLLQEGVCPTTINVDPEIMSYVKTYFDKELQTILDDNALELQWKTNENSALITPRSYKVTPDGKVSTGGKRAEKVEEFLTNFEHKTFSVERDLFKDVSNGLQNQIVEMDARQFKFSMDATRSSVTIVGKTEFVVDKKKEIGDFIESAVGELRMKESVVAHTERDLNKGQLEVLKKSGQLGLIQDSYKYTEIDVNDETGNLVICSPDSTIQEVTIEVMRFVSRVDKEVVRLSKRILDVFHSPKGAKYLNAVFKNENVAASLIIEDEQKTRNEATVYAQNSDQCKKAVELVNSIAKEKFITLTDENMKVIKQHKWNEFIVDQENELIVKIVQDKTHRQTLWLSGVDQDVIKCYDNVNKHINKYSIFHESLAISPGHLKFIFQIWNDKVTKLQDDLQESFLKIKPNYKEMTIKMTGNRNGLQIGKERLLSYVKKIHHEEVAVDKPGISKFLKSTQGLKHLEITERDHNCIIEVMDGNDRLTPQLRSSLSSGGDDFEVVCRRTVTGGKTLSVCKDDLTRHPVDVIVNAANGKLMHSGGLAGAIVRIGGQEIQDESNEYIQNRGHLRPGEVIDTGAGTLPCQRIIHAVGPQWDNTAKQQRANGQKTKQEELLYKAIQNSLAAAKDYQSIAIPAVSSGIFGVPVDLCAKTIIQSTIDFFEINPHCQLSDVRFTNNDDPTVEAFEAEMNRVFKSDDTEKSPINHAKAFPIDAPQLKPKPNPKPPTPDKPKFVAAVTSSPVPPGNNNAALTTPEGVSISVKVGDIAQEHSDVLVNTTGSQMDLQKNNCAKAFSKAAGPDLQRFCDAISPVHEGDIGITQPGKLKCKHVFHVVCSAWNSGSGQKILCSLLEKCLKEAENKKARSISIPAIGTGVLGFPRDTVAMTSLEEVIKFSRNSHPNYLKEVQFVVYHGDQPTVQSFRDELDKRKLSVPHVHGITLGATLPQTLPKPIGKPTGGSDLGTSVDGHLASGGIPNTNDRLEASSASSIETPEKETVTRKPRFYEVKMGKMIVQVEKGDITNETTDALGMLSDPNLDFKTQGPAWEALLRCDGRKIDSERRPHVNKLPIKDGHCVLLSTRHLQAKYLVVCSNKTRKLQKVKRNLVACLNKAEKLEFKTISFPALGAGSDCACMMFSAAKRFSKTQPKSMKLIRIILFQDDMVDDFVDVLKYYAYSTKTVREVFWSGFKALKKYLKKQTKKEQPESLEMRLCVYTGSKGRLSTAVKAIHDLMEEKCVLKEITENEAILDIDEVYMDEIHMLERQLDCKIAVDKDNCKITVQGLSEDVLEAMSNIHSMLHKIVEARHERATAEAIAKDIQWEYEANDTFTPYSVDANAKIEKAYGNQDENVTFQENGEEFTITFASMIEKSTRNGVVGIHTNVRRKELRLGGINVPAHWDDQPTCHNGVEKAVHLVELSPSSTEFTDVKNQFAKTCGCTITKITRVQNPEQYKIYSIRKQRMDESAGSNEKLLFHGTTTESCKNINQKGFNRSYCGKNATVYGLGVYFAVNAEYSARDTYSPADANGNRYMYLARVLTGQYTIGHPSMKEPPPKNPAVPHVTYDTVVNDTNNPAIFVVFYDGQAYPEYLIEFK